MENETITDEDMMVPEKLSDILTLAKHDLRQFVTAIPKNTITSLIKMKENINSMTVDWSMIKRELPHTVTTIQNYIENKSAQRRNIENHIVTILNETENRAIKAEERVTILNELIEKLREKNSLLDSRLREVYEQRISDLKSEDNAARRFLIMNLEELSAKKSLEIKYPDGIKLNEAKLVKKVEETEDKGEEEDAKQEEEHYPF